MCETYDIKFDDSPVGKAQMEKQGLYMLFSCRCSLPDTGIYRIHAVYENKREDLGICVPMGELFGMDKKIPVKQLAGGVPAFELIPRDWQLKLAAAEQTVVPETQIMEVFEETVTDEHEEAELQEQTEEETFIPVREEEPFEYLDKLEKARMELRDDTPGIVIPMEEL